MIFWKGIIGSFLLCSAFAQAAQAETIKNALARAYLAHPQLNAQRANMRGVDESLPMARGAFLPTVSAQGSFGALQQDILPPAVINPNTGVPSAANQRTLTPPATGLIAANLNIFNGFRGINGIDQAEAQIRLSREQLRNTEVGVLANAATAYMNVLRDAAVLKLRQDYVQLLINQVEITEERLRDGEVTRTDVYQAEAALAAAKQQVSTSIVELQTSLAVYRQQIGTPPNKLAPAPVLDALLPKDREEALRIADADHPLAVAARYNIDINELNVKIVGGQLLPTVGLNGQVLQQWNYFGTPRQRFFNGAINLQVNVPLYEGGIVYAQVRQAKEKLGEAQLLYDQQINQIHQGVESIWAAWKESGKFLAAAREQVKKAEAALEGVREEAKFGQRTTWDILNAQATLITARNAFITGQRERVVTGYNLLAAMGQLSATTLGLDVPLYQPEDHYDRVKHQWIGVDPWK